MSLITYTPMQDGHEADDQLFNSRFQAIHDVINGGLDASNLADNAVTTPKITNLGVTTAKIADNAVTSTKIEAQQAWTAVTFQNSWTNLGDPWGKAAYMKDSLGFVWIRGCVTAGTVGVSTPIFTLPAGYRPATNERPRFACISNNALGVVNVYDNGQVNLEIGSNAYLFLDTVRFKAEQ